MLATPFLAGSTATCLADHHRLEAGEEEAGFGFCVGVHDDVKVSDAVIAESGGKAVFGNDDGYVMGPK